MLKFIPLLWANLSRKPLRTSLTLASIMIAFLLFGLLRTLGNAMTGTAEVAGADRLLTLHKISLVMPLPQSYLNRIKSVAGVKVACSHNWFGGIYQQDRNQIAAFAIETDTFFETYPEFELPEAQRSAFLSDRGSAIVGKSLAEQFGWKVGDVIPLRSNIFTRKSGGSVWNLKLAGIFTATNGDNPSLYMHYDYFNEARTLGIDQIGWVVMRIADPQRAPEIARTIDSLFANSATETKTSTEKAFAQGFANQLGNIGAIVTAVASAVFFTMLLVTANTMAQAVRERTSELAVMKTLGFSNGGVMTLVLGEALLITVLGAAIGLGLAAVFASFLSQALQNYFPTLGMPADTYTIGAILAAGLGALSAALPCFQAFQLRIVEALRKS
jgi:putative ABC transport system permease protein